MFFSSNRFLNNFKPAYFNELANSIIVQRCDQYDPKADRIHGMFCSNIIMIWGIFN